MIFKWGIMVGYNFSF